MTYEIVKSVCKLYLTMIALGVRLKSSSARVDGDGYTFVTKQKAVTGRRLTDADLSS